MVAMVIILILTSFAHDMLIYDEGSVYSCPAEHLKDTLDEYNDDQGKNFQIDMISHQKFEDMFYDPLECRPFYKDKDAPIWFGRVEGLSIVNQRLIVFGFVTSEDGQVGKLSLRY